MKLKKLEEAIMAPRTKGRTKLIRKAFTEYKESLEKPWWKKLYERTSSK